MMMMMMNGAQFTLVFPGKQTRLLAVPLDDNLKYPALTTVADVQ